MKRAVTAVLLSILLMAQLAQGQRIFRSNPRYEPLSETFASPKQLEALATEVSQTPAQAAARLEALLREHADELTDSETGGLISIFAWIDNLPVAQRSAVASEYRKQFDAAAGAALAALKQNPTARPEEFHLIAKRWPLSSAAGPALVEAGDRAVAGGDSPAAAAFYELARDAGWTPDEQHAITLAVCHELNEDGVPPLSPAAEKRAKEVAALPAGYRAAVPVTTSWYGQPGGAEIAKYIPYAADGVIYIAGGKQVLAIKENSMVAWAWSPAGAAAKAVPLDRMRATGRAAVYSPAAFAGAAGAQIILVRQPRLVERGICLRALRASDGQLLWSTEGNRALEDMTFVSNPAVAGRYVYAVGLAFANDACSLTLVALDVLDGHTIWRAGLGSVRDMPRLREDDLRNWDTFWEQTEPAVAGSSVYITPSVGGVMSIDRFDGKLRWARPYIGAPSRTVPAPRVAVGAIRRGRWVDGYERVPVPTDPVELSRWRGTPCVFGAYTPSPILVAAPQDCHCVFAFNAKTGVTLWEDQSPTAGTLIGRCGESAILAGAFIHAIEPATGRTRWRWAPPNGAAITGPSAICGDTIYVPTVARIAGISGIDGKPAESRLKPPNFQGVLTSDAGRRALQEAGVLQTFAPPTKK